MQLFGTAGQKQGQTNKQSSDRHAAERWRKGLVHIIELWGRYIKINTIKKDWPALAQ